MTENGFEYIDLGLPSKTMWATCNVGGNKPEDPGLLFQFGRVDGYKYGDRNNKFIEDDLTTTSGKVYKETDVLDLDDDAAHVNMGSVWRMPTICQLKELYNNTTYKVEIINGVKGMLFISNINSKRLFVPFAGYWYNGSFAAVGSSARVWSSQVHAYNAHYAYRLSCYSSDDAYILSNSRPNAFSVRGVFIK